MVHPLDLLTAWSAAHGVRLSTCIEQHLQLQVVLKALLQDRKAAETTKQAKAAKLSFSIRAWARLKAFVLLILLLYTIPGVTCQGCSMQCCSARLLARTLTQEKAIHVDDPRRGLPFECMMFRPSLQRVAVRDVKSIPTQSTGLGCALTCLDHMWSPPKLHRVWHQLGKHHV